MLLYYTIHQKQSKPLSFKEATPSHRTVIGCQIQHQIVMVNDKLASSTKECTNMRACMADSEWTKLLLKFQVPYQKFNLRFLLIPNLIRAFAMAYGMGHLAL